MTATVFLVIIIGSAFTGWLISTLIITGIFWPVKPINIFGMHLQGLLPAKQKQFANRAGTLFQSAFMEYRGLDEKVADPALLEKLKPEIEKHVDQFLQEKLKTVFPLLAQFMGEKTLNQFKTAFMIEIDSLFPVLMKKYIGELKTDIRLDGIIAAKINALSVEQLKQSFHSNAVKEIRNFKIICSCLGLISGIVISLLLLAINPS